MPKINDFLKTPMNKVVIMISIATIFALGCPVEEREACIVKAALAQKESLKMANQDKTNCLREANVSAHIPVTTTIIVGGSIGGAAGGINGGGSQTITEFVLDAGVFNRLAAVCDGRYQSAALAAASKFTSDSNACCQVE